MQISEPLGSQGIILLYHLAICQGIMFYPATGHAMEAWTLSYDKAQEEHSDIPKQ